MKWKMLLKRTGVALLCIFGCFALFIIVATIISKKNPHSQVKQTKTAVVSNTSTSSTTSETATVAQPKITALVVSVDGKKITLDYIQPFYGKEAIIAMKVDGYCKQCSVNDDAVGPSGPAIYDRNNNPLLRTFDLALNVEKLSENRTPLPMSELSSHTLINKETGKRYGLPFEIVFNVKGEVSGIYGVYRP